MKPITPQSPESHSADLVVENTARLKQVFPEVFAEGQIDFETLRQLLGDSLDEGDERYGLHWHGKRRARQLGLTISTGTLRPCPEESENWDETRNVVIEGDNLEALKLLQKSYGRRVKAIYIDPPYNTGRNIVYPNDYTDGIRTYLEVTGQVEGGQKLTSNTEASGRFHSNWLSMIYPRLLVAKNLLRPDGVLFCTIDENEHATLSVIMKEIFPEGAYEHVYVSIVHNPRGQQGKNISYVHENAIIVFPADQKKYLADVAKEEVDSRTLRDSGTQSDRTDAKTCFYPIIVKDGHIIDLGAVPNEDFHPASCNVMRPDGSIEVWPMTDSGDEKKWRYSRESVETILAKLEPKPGRESIQIIFNKDTGTMRSVWQAAKYDSSEYGTKLVERLIGNAGFTFPKSLWAVRDALRIMTEEDPDAIVLDFFAGSGTTGHALWELTKELGGNRRFILVQLPQPLDVNDPDQKLAAEFCDRMNRPRNIAELTKARLRKTAESIRSEIPGWKGDAGFRVFKLDTSNVRTWDPTSEDIEDQLFAHVNHLVEGRNELDILYELILKLGLDLCVPIATRIIQGKRVFSLGQGVLIVCADLSIGQEDYEPLALGIVAWHQETAPVGETTLVFLDNAFADDVVKTNFAAILSQHGLDNVRSL